MPTQAGRYNAWRVPASGAMAFAYWCNDPVISVESTPLDNRSGASTQAKDRWVRLVKRCAASARMSGGRLVHVIVSRFSVVAGRARSSVWTSLGRYCSCPTSFWIGVTRRTMVASTRNGREVRNDEGTRKLTIDRWVKHGWMGEPGGCGGM